MCLSLLGGFELRCGERTLTLPLSAQRLLAFVALQERPVQRVYIAGQIWTSSTQEHANASLRTTLWRLRRGGGPLVDGRGGGMCLMPDVVVDVRRALEHRSDLEDVECLSRARDLLPDWYDDWLIVERERNQLKLFSREDARALPERLRILIGYHYWLPRNMCR